MPATRKRLSLGVGPSGPISSDMGETSFTVSPT